MNISDKYLEEVPNYSYVKSLAKADFAFQQNFIKILKEEYTIDSLAYLYHVKIEEPRAASEIVNKLKYTFSFLSMTQAYKFAELHQEKLRVGDESLHNQFTKILVTIHQFLSKN